jgi:hypothetical protein
VCVCGVYGFIFTSLKIKNEKNTRKIMAKQKTKSLKTVSFA